MATATIPIAPPPSAAATEQATRIVELSLLLTAAADARNIRGHQLTLAHLYEACRALPAETVIPVPRVLEPAGSVARDVNADGLRYELQAVVPEGKPHLMFKLVDVTGDDVLAYMEPEQVRQLIADLARVLGFVESSRG